MAHLRSAVLAVTLCLAGHPGGHAVGAANRAPATGDGPAVTHDLTIEALQGTGSVRRVRLTLPPFADPPVGPFAIERVTIRSGSDTTESLGTFDRLPVDGLVIDVAADQAIRVHREGMSPVTLMPPDSADELVLPPPSAGGELALFSRQRAIRPELYRVVGPVSGDMKDSQWSWPGIPPGDYVVYPAYSGGLEGHELAAKVVAGQSSVVWDGAERIAGLTVRMGAAACEQTEVISVVPGDRAYGRPSVVARADGDCTQEIIGLEAGVYTVVLDGTAGRFASRGVQLTADAVAVVDVETTSIGVEGRIRWHGRPLGHAIVLFRSIDGSSSSAARTDAGGNFRTLLGQAGVFGVAISVSDFELPGILRREEFEERDNRFDWDLEGGALRVTIEGWGRAFPVLLDLQSPGGGSTAPVPLDTLMPIEFVGLPEGAFTVRAVEQVPRQVRAGRPRRVSAWVTANIENSEVPSAVTLRLSDEERMLFVVDGRGVPVDRAIVSFANRVYPGAYRLDGVSPGGGVLVRAPGFAPACVMAPESGTRTVRMVTGRPTRVEFVGREGGGLPDGLLSGSSECGIPFSYFEVQRADDAPEGSAAFLFLNFPAVGDLVYALGWSKGPVVRGPDGVVRISGRAGRR